MIEGYFSLAFFLQRQILHSYRSESTGLAVAALID
jgi:hypothetical protein